jgi:hypothetical protein
MGWVLNGNLLILGSTEIWIDRRSISGSGIVLYDWTSSRTRIAIQKCGPSMVLVYIAVFPIVVIAVGVAVAVAITLTCALTVAVALTVALTVALAVSVAVVIIAIALDEDVSWKV